MRLRNTYESPTSDLQSASGSRKFTSYAIFGTLVIVWVTASPIIWWQIYISTFGFQPDLVLMFQPAILAAIGLLAAPLLWRGVIKAAIALICLSVGVACSLALCLSVFPGGVILNAGLLSGIGIVSWLRSRKSPYVIRDE